jgi:GntR family transcriptional regulator
MSDGKRAIAADAGNHCKKVELFADSSTFFAKYLNKDLTDRIQRSMLVTRLITRLTNQQARRRYAMLDFQDERPIFLQLAEQLEDGILSGVYAEESQVPSITEYAVNYRINPATANKGINLLVDAGLLYKKRGVGMFVAEGAQEKLRIQRKERFYHDYIERAVREAKHLGLTAGQLAEMMQRGFEENVD